MGILYVDNDMLLLAQQLHTYDQTGQKVYLDSGATVTVTLTDPGGVALAGETWPLALSYVLGSAGNFFTVLRHEIAFPAPGSTVLARLVVDNGQDQHGEMTGKLTVQDRPW